MNAFFSANNNQKVANVGKEISPFDWYISADQIFASNVEGFENYSKIFSLEYRISRSAVFDKVKVADSAVMAEDVKIYMGPGRHCAMIQGRMAKGVVIPKITVKKTQYISEELAVLETKEFSKCVIQSFERKGELVTFAFRYASYSDSYIDYKDDGTKGGNAATQIDFADWKVENS